MCYTMNENRSHDTYRSFTQRWFCCVPFFFFRVRYEAIKVTAVVVVVVVAHLYILIYPFPCYLFLSISKCMFVQLFFLFSMKPIDIARGADDTLFQKKKNWCSCNCSYYIFTNFKCTRPFFCSSHYITLDNRRCTCNTMNNEIFSSIWTVQFNL